MNINNDFPLVSSSKEAVVYMGKKVRFLCTNCNKLTIRQIRSDRPKTYTIFMCPKCSREKTCLERFGAKSNLVVMSNPKKVWAEKYNLIIEKRQQTCLKKYGCTNQLKNKVVQEKVITVKQTKSSLFENENNCTSVKSLVKKYGQGWKIAKIITNYIYNDKHTRKYVSNDDIPLIEKYFSEGRCHTNGYTSKKEKELLDYIKSIYLGKIIENDTSAVPNLNHRYYELDIYLPDLNIAFDFDGNYYHSLKFKDKYYHQRKTLCCYKQNIRLAHILESSWNDDNENIKTKIKDLIFSNKSFNDGFFPSKDFKDIRLSEPRKVQVGNLEYYDTGVSL